MTLEMAFAERKSISSSPAVIPSSPAFLSSTEILSPILKPLAERHAVVICIPSKRMPRPKLHQKWRQESKMISKKKVHPPVCVPPPSVSPSLQKKESEAITILAGLKK